MQRSFSDRVFGGVCGGLAASLRANAWTVRVIFTALTVLSLGAFAVVYVLLWWIVPQQTFVEARRGVPTLIVLLLIVLISAAWVAITFNLVALPVAFPANVSPFWVSAGVVLSAVFFLRQLRG